MTGRPWQYYDLLVQHGLPQNHQSESHPRLHFRVLQSY